jgi:hypothetical protein
MKKKAVKITVQRLREMFASVNILGFGVSFRPSEPDRKIIRKLILALEDRRALFAASTSVNAHHVVESLDKVRDQITSALQSIDGDRETVAALKVMRSACLDFMDSLPKHQSRDELFHLVVDDRRIQEHFNIRLGMLRGTIGLQLARLADAYGLDLDQRFKSIIPIGAVAESKQ